MCLPAAFQDIFGKMSVKVLKMFRKCSGKCPGNVQQFCGNVLEMSGKCLEMFPKMSWKFLGFVRKNVPENSKKKSGKLRKFPVKLSGHFPEISRTFPGHFREILPVPEARLRGLHVCDELSFTRMQGLPLFAHAGDMIVNA